MTNIVEREWGWYRILQESPEYKIKELILNPGFSLPRKQYPVKKHWFMLRGQVSVQTEYLDVPQTIVFYQGASYNIDAGVWHSIHNDTDTQCHILEVRH